MSHKPNTNISIRLIGGLLSVIAAPVYGLTPVEVARLLAADGAEGDQFGYAVAVDGDTALISALLDNDVDERTGSAYVFTRSGDKWSFQAKLTANDGTNNSKLGRSVALDGDTALIGDSHTSSNDSSSVYVFTRNGTSWSQQAKLNASDGETSPNEADLFGHSVALDGDTALIGARSADGNVDNTGAAYVFVRDGTTWTEQAKLIADDGADRDWFGDSVALSGDTALINARQDDDGGEATGSAYVFTRSGSAWSQQAKLTANDAEPVDRFGASVALDGNTALIGAAGNGSVYYFLRSDSTWSQQGKLVLSEGEVSSGLGGKLALQGDIALIKGVALINGTIEPAVYPFIRSGTSWRQQGRIVATYAEISGGFGSSIALDGDTVLIGASGGINFGIRTGSAYVYDISTPIVFVQDEGGLLSFEAEHFSDNVAAGGARRWARVDPAAPNASNEQAIKAANGPATATPGLGSFTNYVVVLQPGTHDVWVRFRAFSLGTDSLYFQFENGAIQYKDLDPEDSEWRWVRLDSPITVDTAGLYTLRVYRRERLAELDKIILTSDPDFDPTFVNGGHGPFESARLVPCDMTLDFDGDLEPDCSDPDDDNDGINDWFEIENRLDRFDPTDALLDSDDDGLSNLDEFLRNDDLDPNDPDTDDDGIGDALDTQPSYAKNECTGGDLINATLERPVDRELTCAARETIIVNPPTEVQDPDGYLILMARKVSFQDGFKAGRLTVIGKDPCPNCVSEPSEFITSFTVPGGSIFGHLPAPQTYGFDYFFTPLMLDLAVLGNGVTIDSVEVESFGQNSGAAVNFDWEVHIGPVPFAFPEGQFIQTLVDPVSGYVRIAPTQFRFSIGSQIDSQSYLFSGQHDFTTNTTTAMPYLSTVHAASMSPMNLTEGLYVQLFLWTADNRNVRIEFGDITVTIRGKIPPP